MKRRMIWLAAIAGLLVLGLVGQAVAAEAVQRAAGTRFSCGEVCGEPVTVAGTVSDQAWNTLTVDASGTVYTVKTGPYKTGRNLPDLLGKNVTVVGFTGTGGSCRSEDPPANVIQARTITADDEVYDLTQVPTGSEWGVGNRSGQEQGTANQLRTRQSGGQGAGNRQGRCGSGSCGNGRGSL